MSRDKGLGFVLLSVSLPPMAQFLVGCSVISSFLLDEYSDPLMRQNLALLFLCGTAGNEPGCSKTGS